MTSDTTEYSFILSSEPDIEGFYAYSIIPPGGLYPVTGRRRGEHASVRDYIAQKVAKLNKDVAISFRLPKTNPDSLRISRERRWKKPYQRGEKRIQEILTKDRRDS